MILLVTNKRDLTTDYIVKELKNRNISYYRLNTETIPEYECNIGYSSLDDWSINNITGKMVTAAYFRRPSIPICNHPFLKEEEIKYIKMEWLSFLKSIYYCIDNKWFSTPTNIALAEDKPRQLVLANSIGFNIPKCIISNNVFDVIEKTSNKNLINKPLRQSLIEGDKERVIFTNRIPTLTPKYKKSISFSPSIFQQEIIKKFDVRVTVVGEHVFPVAIWSQTTKQTEVDWRNGASINLVHEHIQLPLNISEQCIALVKKLNLKFGAIDLICDLNERYWFLEINPNGQWAWIENQTNLPIASTIVDELLKISEINHE